MTIDVFVHPEFPSHGPDPRTEVYHSYLSHLERVFYQSEQPILIPGLVSDSFAELFAPEQVVSSTSHYLDPHCEWPMDRGEVDPAEWGRFTSLINPDDEFRVHGAYLGHCPEGFAVQLFGYLARGEHWHNWKAVCDEEAEGREVELRKHHEYNGDFAAGNIRYGVVLDFVANASVVKPGRFPLFSRRDTPYGNITYQLIDEHTVVYGRE